jgi:hypothetical protein
MGLLIPGSVCFPGGHAHGKFMAAIGAVTVSLRQAKKFLTSHKLIMALRARDIFKISHASLPNRIGILE